MEPTLRARARTFGHNSFWLACDFCSRNFLPIRSLSWPQKRISCRWLEIVRSFLLHCLVWRALTLVSLSSVVSWLRELPAVLLFTLLRHIFPETCVLHSGTSLAVTIACYRSMKMDHLGLDDRILGGR